MKSEGMFKLLRHIWEILCEHTSKIVMVNHAHDVFRCEYVDNIKRDLLEVKHEDIG
jgi:hypothetical protein